MSSDFGVVMTTILKINPVLLVPILFSVYCCLRAWPAKNQDEDAPKRTFIDGVFRMTSVIHLFIHHSTILQAFLVIRCFLQIITDPTHHNPDEVVAQSGTFLLFLWCYVISTSNYEPSSNLFVTSNHDERHVS